MQISELKATAASAVEKLLEKGADKAQCLVRYSEKREFNVDGGEFSLLRTLFEKAISLTALKDGKRGAFSTNRFDEASLEAASAGCIEALSSAEPDLAWDFAPEAENKLFSSGVTEGDMEKFFDRLRELMRDIAERHPKIIMEQLVASHDKRNSVYRNSLGAEFGNTSGEYTVELMFSGHEGEKSSSFFGSALTTVCLDKPFIEQGSIEKDLSDVEKQIETLSFKGKEEGILVLTPACTADLVSTAFDNFAGGTSLIEGTSPWKDSLGKAVASDSLTASFKPFDERIVSGQRFTGEGFAAEDYTLIENGVLKSFMASLYVANKLGIERAKNSSSSLIIEPGEKSIDEIISGIKKGILVARFSGGAPSTNGDFSGVAKNCFIIEDGKIGSALSETMINGNLADMLKNVVGISRELVCDGVMVLPYMAFSGITISGS